MKTIYEVLKTYDREKIIDTYMYHYSWKVWECPIDSDITVNQYKERLKAKINHHIDHLLSAIPKPDKNSVLLVHHVISSRDIADDIDFVLVKLDEEFGEYGPTSYAFEFSSTEEIMGYYVSDAYTTQYYLDELLAYFIHESSFFGWEREFLEEERAELEHRMDEVESGEAKFIPAEEAFKDLFEGTDWTPEIRNKEEEKEEKELMKMIWKYNKSCLAREIAATKTANLDN